VVFRPTHARFAADLLDDCRAELLRVTTTLDGYIELADRLRDERSAAVVASAPGNREKLVAAAAYGQWISDHIRQQTAGWRMADGAAAAGYSTDSDERILRQRLLAEAEAAADSLADIRPSVQPPPRPGELESTETLPADSLGKLERAWEWCGTAFWAAGMSSAVGMQTVKGHIGTLLSWLERQRPMSDPEQADSGTTV
jgi:hypothetical protein